MNNETPTPDSKKPGDGDPLQKVLINIPPGLMRDAIAQIIKGKPKGNWTMAWRDQPNPAVSPYEKPKSTCDLDTITTQALFNLILPTDPTDVSVSRPADTVPGAVPMAAIMGAFRNRKAVPFLGAGVPLSGRKKGDLWDTGQPFLPSSVELARHLADNCQMPVWNLQEDINLARVASYYAVTNGTDTLSADLEVIFQNGDPTPTHRFLADPRLGTMLIVTTNYDLLMEKALDEQSVDYDRIIHCGQRGDKGAFYYGNKIGPVRQVSDDELLGLVDVTKKTVLYKMHGSVGLEVIDESVDDYGEENSFVITEENYVEFLSRINSSAPIVPKAIVKAFKNKSILFLGYSLDDWNLRVILHSLKDVLRGNNQQTTARILGITPANSHWAIQRSPTAYDATIWGARGVTFGQRDLNIFVDQLRTGLGIPAVIKR